MMVYTTEKRFKVIIVFTHPLWMVGYLSVIIYSSLSKTFSGMFADTPWNVWRHFAEFLRTFPGMFGYIPRIIWRHSPELLRTFSRMFGVECLRTFLGMFCDILQNVWRHFPQFFRIFPGMFEDFLRNVWRHFTEYYIAPIPRVSRIPFPVPVFLVLYKFVQKHKEAIKYVKK